ncbi:MAG: DNA-directed RNA polymerase subunit omega [Melioribacteraceae bacterium]|nr:DNA-directed RNA polymerase subunit omega [Melioribacteraceae bacterium]MCF8353277.1 DNA-directed RNA polymerase subunit omega [Melioribacteraceae bacterium]MCF8394837.1 DNA-directed RNA polymerase subunit omega [Melioribacteraceae bacterium]MCF8418804.1 DNA-directed RNA polymerase subunit omega [Melioribacteraceae bacterium]
MSNNIKPIELGKLEKHASNVYEAVIAAGKKARNINDSNKQEYTTLLNTLVPGIEDDFEEKENPDQLRISLEFEKRPKPHRQALQMLVDGDLKFRYKENILED